jgi:hypothetical protein
VLREFARLALVSVAVSGRAYGQESDKSFSLRVDGTAACSTPGQLRQELETKLGGYSFQLSGDPASQGPQQSLEVPWVVVTFDGEVPHLSVGVRIGRAQGKEVVRTLTARDCAEAQLAAAFIVSVALLGSDEAATNGQGTGGGNGAAPSDAEERELDKAQPLRQESGTPSARRSRPGLDATAPRPRRASPVRVWLEADGIMELGPAPNPLFGAGFGVGIGQARPGLLSPAIVLNAVYLAALPASTFDGDAAFDFGALGLALCPSYGRWDTLTLRLCATAHLGFLRAAGFNTVDARTSTRLWGDAGALVSAHWFFARRFGFHLALEGKVPWERPRFLFDSEEFHTVPPLIMGARLGFVLEIP